MIPDKKLQSIEHDYEQEALKLIVQFCSEGQEQITNVSKTQFGFARSTIDQQKQQSNQKQFLKVTLINYKLLSKHEGQLKDDEISNLTKSIYSIQDLFDHIKAHLPMALQNNKELKLQGGGFQYILSSILEVKAGKQIIEYLIECKLLSKQINVDEKFEILSQYWKNLMIKQDLKIAELQKQLNSLGVKNNTTQNFTQNQMIGSQQQNQFQNQIPNQAQNQNPNQKQNQFPSQIQNQFQNKIQNQTPSQTQNQIPNEIPNEILSQVQNQILSQIQNLIQKQNEKINQLEQQIQSISDYVKNLKSDAAIQQNQSVEKHSDKPQANRVSLSSLEQRDNGYLITNVLQQGFHEFVAVLQDKLDNEIEFEIGILADGDFEELETKAKAFYFEFPDGKFRRGDEPSDKIITYSFQKNTKIGIKVNTIEHWATASLNGYDFAPISLPNGLENFAFILKITTEGKQLDDVLEELEQ